MEEVEVSKESEPKPAKKKTSSKRRVKKKVTLSADDNIISDDPVAALEIAKSFSKTKAREADTARQVHATHARIMTESAPKPTRRRKSGKVTFDPPKKLKDVPYLTPKEQEAPDIMKALKESKNTSRRQPITRASNEGTGSKPGVPDESTVISATSNERTCTQPGVPDEERSVISATSIERTGTQPGVPDEERSGTQPGVPDEERCRILEIITQ
nr:hypothetical protein [Tanacetum cinerariifolium]